MGVFIVKEILPSEYGEVILVLELVHFLVFLGKSKYKIKIIES